MLPLPVLKTGVLLSFNPPIMSVRVPYWKWILTCNVGTKFEFRAGKARFSFHMPLFIQDTNERRRRKIYVDLKNFRSKLYIIYVVAIIPFEFYEWRKNVTRSRITFVVLALSFALHTFQPSPASWPYVEELSNCVSYHHLPRASWRNKCKGIRRERERELIARNSVRCGNFFLHPSIHPILAGSLINVCVCTENPSHEWRIPQEKKVHLSISGLLWKISFKKRGKNVYPVVCVIAAYIYFSLPTMSRWKFFRDLSPSPGLGMQFTVGSYKFDTW